MKKVYYLLLSLLISACVTSPSTVPDPGALAESRGYQLGEEVREIHNYEVSGWQYVSNRAVIIPARPSSHYLLILDRECHDLRGTEMIGFTTTVNRLQARFDAVVVPDRPGAMAEKCYIDRIYKISKD